MHPISNSRHHIYGLNLGEIGGEVVGGERREHFPDPCCALGRESALECGGGFPAHGVVRAGDERALEALLGGAHRGRGEDGVDVKRHRHADGLDDADDAAGFALGGGCELAMMCDFIIAADNAKFGQPEIKIGIIPGAGGTQRLPRAVGKSKAMDMVLTARMMDAQEAERAGLVSRVVPLDKLMDEALGAALVICGYGQLAVMAAKESVNRAFEGGLSDGLMFERRLFHALFATADQKEGMDAFLSKRAPNFVNG